MNTLKFPKPSDFVCTACATGKLILRPSYLKIKAEPLTFLERIQGDICGPIHPLTGPFRYFMVLIDASTRWSHVCLLSTRNYAFEQFIAQIIKLRAHYLDNLIKSIRIDNATKFSSKAFNDYCMALGINGNYKENKINCKTIITELQVTNILLGSCGFTRR